MAPGRTPNNKLVLSTVFQLNVAQAAATYTLATVSGGDILVLCAVPYIGAAAVTTLTSVAIVTNSTTVVTILSAASGAVGNLTADKSLAPFTTQFVLRSGKLIQYSLVGSTGAGGPMSLAVQYLPLTDAALLS